MCVNRFSNMIGGAFVGFPLVLTLLNRKVDHLYVSVWYMGCALFWFPVLFLVANTKTSPRVGRRK